MSNLEARTPSRLLLLGGEPFGEDVLMWWNFVVRTHDEVVPASGGSSAPTGSGGSPATATSASRPRRSPTSP